MHEYDIFWPLINWFINKPDKEYPISCKYNVSDMETPLIYTSQELIFQKTEQIWAIFEFIDSCSVNEASKKINYSIDGIIIFHDYFGNKIPYRKIQVGSRRGWREEEIVDTMPDGIGIADILEKTKNEELIQVYKAKNWQLKIYHKYFCDYYEGRTRTEWKLFGDLLKRIALQNIAGQEYEFAKITKPEEEAKW